jgi:hypothetical protein
MNLFGDSDYLEKLSLKGDPLERLEKAMISCKKCTKSLLILKSDILDIRNNELNKEYKKRATTNLFSAKKISCEPLIDYQQSIKEVEPQNLVKYLITLLSRYLNICKPIISGF